MRAQVHHNCPFKYIPPVERCGNMDYNNANFQKNGFINGDYDLGPLDPQQNNLQLTIQNNVICTQ